MEAAEDIKAARRDPKNQFVHFLSVDVSNDSQTQSAIRKHIDAHGAVDVLITSAG